MNILSAGGPGSEQPAPRPRFHEFPRWSDDAFSTWPPQRSHGRIAGDPVAQLADAMAVSSHHPSPTTHRAGAPLRCH
ncbi:hypothetical protein AB0P15_33540 [Streptomyces sp. NPDC087917]|uniref:hypothetical protein n=1 Tax=Streptomyces sp. NPDC087917 TaxID=3155060 RepID=UPI00342ABC74